MYRERVPYYRKLEQLFESKLLVYITSDRPNMAAQIAPDVIEYFIDHLDKMRSSCDKISLFLYTRGGNTSAARNIVNLLRMYCENLQVIVPYKAHSAGTIISLGANEIVMTKQATLGPIDPSLHTPLNPRVEGSIYPVSVEAVKGYLGFAKDELGISDTASLTSIFEKLTDFVHPLVLGEVYRSKAQIQMMAKKLLQNQVTDPEKIKRIIDFLCSESGSHDYTINRREARNELGLNIRNPNDEEYELIKKIYDDINDELLFSKPFLRSEINGSYSVRRCLLESVIGGSDYFSTEGVVVRGTTPDGQPAIQNKVNFEGWRHDLSSDQSEMTVGVGGEEIIYERGSEYRI